MEHFPTSSRALIQDAFREKQILLDGRAVVKSASVTEGQCVSIVRLYERTDRLPIVEAGFINVVYEDAAVIALNKPGGQACHPIQPGERGTLVNALLARYPEITHVGDDSMMPGLLHRIDAGTSGLVLCAKTSSAYSMIRRQFVEHTVEKVYWAVVEGICEKAGGISGWLAHCPSFRGRMRCVQAGSLPKEERPMFAETFYRPLAVGKNRTLLEVTIETGVTHQIRCQLASIGHPICGDETYGAHDGCREGDFGRYHLLHARRVSFEHPLTQKRMTLEASASPDFCV